jgi:E-phenylitaconyl-CoA hydratase
VSNAPVLQVTLEGGVAWVHLDRPEQRNAISRQMRHELTLAFGGLESDPAVRVAVLTGNGPAFCAGVDLKEAPAAPGDADVFATKPVASPLESFEKPLLAAVNGPAIGGGLELALAADIRIASTSARFGLPEVQLGSLPGSGGTQRLPQVAFPAVAAKMLFPGEPIDAEEALRCGLVSDVTTPEGLIPLAEEIANRIAANAPLSLRAAKLALRAAVQGAETGRTLERTLWGLLSETSDRAEGRAAFRERRPPRFTGT